MGIWGSLGVFGNPEELWSALKSDVAGDVLEITVGRKRMSQGTLDFIDQSQGQA